MLAPSTNPTLADVFAPQTRIAADGMVLKPAVKYQRVAEKFIPRDNH